MSASNIMQAMIEHGVGIRVANIINPSIVGAIVFDLGTRIGQYDPMYGSEAFDNLTTAPVKGGNVGAGTGTTVGKFQAVEEGTRSGAMKAGVGSARVDLGHGVRVCALSVVNAIGNVIRPDGSILAGNRDENKKFQTFEETTEFVTAGETNTTISVVGINVDLRSMENYERVAHVASHGQVRAINPVHTSVDGDTVFVFSTEEHKSFMNDAGTAMQTPNWPYFSVDLIGQAAAKAVQESIVNACNEAETIQYEMGYNGTILSAKAYN